MPRDPLGKVVEAELRKAVKVSLLVKGADYHSEVAAPYINEYVQRKTLRELGFTEDLSRLDCLSAEAFCIIEAEINKVQSEKKRG